MVILEQGEFQPNITGVLMKRENLDRDIHAERYHVKMKARDKGDASRSQGATKISSKPPKLGESLGLILPGSLKRK